MRIFTIGYEGTTQVELIETLGAAGVTRLIDVRAVPLSRKPGFSKKGLAAALAEAGIDYAHLRALGTPPEGREAARRKQIDRMHAIYDAQLEEPDAIAQTAMLLDMVAEKSSALLCFEREAAACHRSRLIARVAPQAEVVDLLP